MKKNILIVMILIFLAAYLGYLYGNQAGSASVDESVLRLAHAIGANRSYSNANASMQDLRSENDLLFGLNKILENLCYAQAGELGRCEAACQK